MRLAALGFWRFGVLALLWLYSGFRAYLSICARDIAAHRRWMLCNFSLTFAAVTLRRWLPFLQAEPKGSAKSDCP